MRGGGRLITNNVSTELCKNLIIILGIDLGITY